MQNAALFSYLGTLFFGIFDLVSFLTYQCIAEISAMSA